MFVNVVTIANLSLQNCVKEKKVSASGVETEKLEAESTTFTWQEGKGKVGEVRKTNSHLTLQIL